MTAPYQIAGFPESQEIVSGEPNMDPTAAAPDTDTGDTAPKKPIGPSLATIGKGFWLEGEPEKVAKDIDIKWNAQNKGMKTRLARWDLNCKRRDGDSYSKLVKDTDQDTFKVYTPPGITQAPPSLNKTDDLSVKMVANLNADPPAPDCEPGTDTDEDRSSAEFSTRLLEIESTESGINIPELVEEAQDLGCSYGSGFVYLYVDPQGGGHRPKEIMAPQGATEIGPDGQPVLEMPGQPDPLTGQPGPPIPIQGEPVIRYVGTDQVTIVDDPSQALLEWVPKVCADTITGENLRFLPEVCSGIRDADGVLIAAFTTLGSLKARFPDVAKMQPDELQKLVSYRPEIAKTLLPKHAGNGEGTKGPDYKSENGPPLDALCLTITGYRKGGGEYPLGAYAVMGGEKFLLHRQEWKEPIRARNGKMTERAMEIPVAQFAQFRTSRRDRDPYRRGIVDLVSDGDPIRAFVTGAIIEYLHRANNPHTYVPIGSGIQPKSGQLPRGTPIYFNPAGGAKPQQEDVAQLSPVFMEFHGMVSAEMDSRSGLQQAAQGVESASVQSGKHAQQIIEQALVALGGVKRSSDSGYMRLCRIVLQLWRTFYTTPRRVKIMGDGGAFKEREFMNTDLGTTTDVKIRVGTSTMLTPSAKSATALEKFQLQAITLEDYQRAEEGNVRTLIGAQDNPHKTRITGQISDWNDGPPEGWLPAAPQVDPNTGQPPVDAATGQPLPPPVDPSNPFADQRAVDQEQTVAVVRHQALSRAMGGSKYATKPPEWQQFLLTEYDLMRRAAGIATLAEQQMAAQQQQQMQAEQEGAAADKTHSQGMEKQAAAADAKSAQEQQRIDGQAAVKSMSPATSGAPAR